MSQQKNRVVKPARVRIRHEVAVASSFFTAQELFEQLLDLQKKYSLKDVDVTVTESYGHSHELSFATYRTETDAEYETRLKRIEDTERRQFAVLKKKFESKA